MEVNSDELKSKGINSDTETNLGNKENVDLGPTLALAAQNESYLKEYKVLLPKDTDSMVVTVPSKINEMSPVEDNSTVEYDFSGLDKELSDAHSPELDQPSPSQTNTILPDEVAQANYETCTMDNSSPERAGALSSEKLNSESFTYPPSSSIQRRKVI